MSQWRPIANYRKDPAINGMYLVSDDGQVKRKSRAMDGSKVLKQKLINTGYYRVDLSVNGTIYYALVHRLVASTFIPNPDKKEQVNHKNGDRTDNRVENLEWITAHEKGLHQEKNRRARVEKLSQEAIKRAKENALWEVISALKKKYGVD